MKTELFSMWLAISAGVWVSEWTFMGKHWESAFNATWWIGITCVYAAYRFRYYKPN